MYLVFDCETSGFHDPKLSFDDPYQGRIIQMAALLLNTDFKEVGNFCSLIRIPNHVEMGDKAFELHGITSLECIRYGVPIESAIIMLDSFNCVAQYQVAHNMKFDSRMIHEEEREIFGGHRLKLSNPICTMEATTELCKLPHPSGRAGYKWPKLSEAYHHLFGKELEDAHSALGDVRATAAIFKHLVQEGFINVERAIEEE